MNKSLKLPTFSDGTTKFYSFTTKIPPHQPIPGITISGTFGTISRALLMWRCEEHYMKHEAGKSPKDLGKFYIVSWQTYGPGYSGCENVFEALDTFEKKGWHLVHSEGPRKHPGCMPSYYFDAEKLEMVPEIIDVSSRMVPLPKDWAKINAKVIEEMDKSPEDAQLERMNSMAKANLEEVVRAVKEGKL